MARGYVSYMRPVAVGLATLLVAGTAIARGGVDLPVVWAAVVTAAAVLALAPRATGRGSTGSKRTDGAAAPGGSAVAGGPRRDGEGIPVLPLALALGTGVVALQLVPLPLGLVRALSPATAAVLDESLAPIGLLGGWRPVSLAPGATALELAKAALLTAVAAAGAILGGSERRRDQLLRGLALAGVAVVAVYYVAALLGVSPLVSPRVTFVNPNNLAGFLLLTAWPALGFALRARGPARAAWLAAFTFAASGVFLSLSRAGIAAFFVAGGVFAVVRIRAGAGKIERPPHPDPLPPLARGERGRRGGGRTVAAGGFAAALAVAAWLALDPILAELQTIGEERTTEVKLGLWPAAVSVLEDFPLLGIGRGAFATVYPAYKSEPVQRTFTHVENEWLQLPVDLGLLVGAGVIALFAWAFLAAARRRDLSRPLTGALAGAGAVAAQSLFDLGLELPGVAIPFALVLGIASRDMPRFEVRPAIVRAAAGALLALAALGLALHQAWPGEEDVAAVISAPTAAEAIARARAVLPSTPAHWAPPAAVGQKLAAEDRCAEAVPWLTRAMQRSPTSPEPHRAMAVCLARAGRDDLARREFRLAFLYGDRGALADAFAWYPAPGALIAIAPDTPAGLLEAGRLLRDRPEEAAEAWSRAWESFGLTSALAQLATTRLTLGAADEALRLARLLEERSPRSAAGYVVAARALDALGRGDEALAELELGASRLPGEPEILAPLGARHLAQRRFSQAKLVFDGIVAKEGPAQTRKRILVARALEGQGRYQEALREAQVARDVTPGDVGALETFARIAGLVGRYDEAIAALELAARRPDAKAGAYDERLADLRRAQEAQREQRVIQGLGAP